MMTGEKQGPVTYAVFGVEIKQGSLPKAVPLFEIQESEKLFVLFLNSTRAFEYAKLRKHSASDGCYNPKHQAEVPQNLMALASE